jgi:3-keto-5-aminohexanoate cleavage enzyme
MSSKNKLILTAAITGAELTKKETPYLPITPEEQAIAAKEAVAAGASVLHIHVRDDSGKPSQELNHFKRSVEAIRKACGPAPVIQFSTGGAVGEKMEKRIAPLSLKPDMASFNLGTMNFGNDIFVNTRPDMRLLADAFKKYSVMPEYEIYDLGHIDELKALIKEEKVQGPYHVQFVLGVPGGAIGDKKRIEFLVSELPPDSHWGVAGIGRFERPLAEVAIELGGQVRVGLEDNIYLRKGVLAKSNAELVADIAALAKEKGRQIATPEEARKLLFL